MKNYLLLLSLVFVEALWAQRTKPTTIMTQQQPEPTAPAILPKEAAAFFESFQTAVRYIANKQIPAATRRTYAQSFASKFAEGAIIEVQNGNNKRTYAPLAYFNRLIDLNYEVVKIRIHVEGNTPFQQDARSWWTTTYIFGQWFLGTRNGETLVRDYSIKKIGLYFLYTPATRTWTKKYGHVTVESIQP